MGFDLSILWWGQISKADRDIDELDNLACIEAITVEQFEAIVRQKDGVLGRLTRWLKRPQRQQPVPAAQPAVHETDSALVEYEPGEQSKTWQAAIQQGKKLILDQSTTGSGKSYSAGQLSPELLGADQLIYASEQHRNPTVDTLSLKMNGWIWKPGTGV